MTLNPGNLNRRVTIQTPTTTPDGMGGYTESWAEASGWAAIWFLGGAERLEAMKMDAPPEARVRMRYEWKGSVTAASRLVHDGVTYEVVSEPWQSQDRTFVEFMVRRVVNG